jgi:hypothetical protein
MNWTSALPVTAWPILTHFLSRDVKTSSWQTDSSAEVICSIWWTQALVDRFMTTTRARVEQQQLRPICSYHSKPVVLMQLVGPWSSAILMDFTAVTRKNADSWNMMSCGSCKSRLFVGTYRLHHQSRENKRERNKVSRN